MIVMTLDRRERDNDPNNSGQKKERKEKSAFTKKMGLENTILLAQRESNCSKKISTFAGASNFNF